MKPELLAPAGNYDCFKAAIHAGCDAVYLAGKHFGARNFAGNFSDDELIEAIKYAHLYGVKVYVTVNTLIYDAEVKSFIDYIRFLHQNNVDALIIQDIGMIALIKKKFPNLELHASTQMHIHNVEGLKLMQKIGIKRAVVARETDINLLKEMSKENIDLEVFIHGALCMCYSGQCLMSSLIGGRSGNRGTCAQCCRQPYSLEVDNKIIRSNKYLLSTKDLNVSKYIGKLIDLGIKSLKIEGRMKRPEYVYQVVSFYRRIIDNYLKDKKTNIDEIDIKELKKLFNREFTKGFLFNEENNNYVNEERPNHMGIPIGKVVTYQKPYVSIKLSDDLSINDGIRIVSLNDVGFNVTEMFKDKKKVLEAFKGDIVSLKIKEKVNVNDQVLKTTDYKQLKEINTKINEMNRKICINGVVFLEDNNLILIINDGVNEASNMIQNIEESKTSPTTKDTILKQLNKLGDTPYIFNSLNIDIPNNLFIPISSLNELRRGAISLLNEKRQYQISFLENEFKMDVPSFKKEQNKNILINNKTDLSKIDLNSYHEVYVDNIDLFNSLNIKNKVLKLPRVILKHNEYNQKLLVGELGSVNKYKNVYTDFSLNVTNAYAVGLLHSLGVLKVTLSYELNDYQIEKLYNNYLKIFNKHPNLEIITDGYEEVMVSRYNILDKYNIKDNAYLIDRFKNKYKIVREGKFMVLYNFKKRHLTGDYFKLGVNNIRINMEK